MSVHVIFESKLQLNELKDLNMTHKIDFSTTSSEAIIEALCKRVDEIRLSRNLSQVDLAHEAGVSRSTLTRMADGKAPSLDSFVRVMMALGLADHLEAMLPDPGVRPVERVRLAGTERKRASRKKQETADWQWGDSSK
jgi:transcriptional regulator with XRE-family HTH domain